jgi:hypothetical protein
MSESANESAVMAESSMSAKEYTGGSVSYYTVRVTNPTTPGKPAYEAECNDIIEALGMSYAEGNAFKAIWRRCAARTLGISKAGYQDGKYDAEKVEFFGRRMVVQETVKEPVSLRLETTEEAEARLKAQSLGPLWVGPNGVLPGRHIPFSRMDIIGQNGNTGEHYADLATKGE